MSSASGVGMRSGSEGRAAGVSTTHGFEDDGEEFWSVV